MGKTTHPEHGIRTGEGSAAGRPCGGPLTRDTDIMGGVAPGFAACAACGDHVKVDAATMKRVVAADKAIQARIDREDKGHMKPGPKPGSKAATRTLSLFDAFATFLAPPDERP